MGGLVSAAVHRVVLAISQVLENKRNILLLAKHERQNVLCDP